MISDISTAAAALNTCIPKAPSPAFSISPSMSGLLSDTPTNHQESTNAQTDATPPNPSLSIRQPSELVAMEFPTDDLLLECGILCKSQGMTLLGPGGVGKSRLTIQLSASLVLGRPFLGLAVNCTRKKILLVQTENLNRRLHQDLSKMKAAWSEEEWGLINNHLFLHTVEHDIDQNLTLKDVENVNALGRLMKEVKADVVIFDPLYAFAKGNLNNDTGMTKTCAELTKLARLGNQEAAVIIVHHTLTGKKGAEMAMGADRASYGRGSKALHSWTRGQINVMEHPTQKGGVILACGKNSNGPEFEPIAAVLNLQTHLYDVDALFDPSTLGGKAVDKKLTAEDVAAYVRDVPLKKKALVEAIIEDTGYGKSKAYDAVDIATGKTIRLNQAREFTVIA